MCVGSSGELVRFHHYLSRQVEVEVMPLEVILEIEARRVEVKLVAMLFLVGQG